MSNLNDAERAIMAGVKGALTFVNTTGNDTYTATMAPAIDAYNTGSFYAVNFASSNTGTTPTLNLNSVAAKTIIQRDGTALVVGSLNGPSVMEYDGTNFRLLMSAVTSVAGKVGAVTLATTDLTNGSNVVLTSSTATVFRNGTGATSGGNATVTFSTPFPTSCDGIVCTGAGVNTVFYETARSSTTASISSDIDGAFWFIACGH